MKESGYRAPPPENELTELRDTWWFWSQDVLEEHTEMQKCVSELVLTKSHLWVHSHASGFSFLIQLQTQTYPSVGLGKSVVSLTNDKCVTM